MTLPHRDHGEAVAARPWPPWLQGLVSAVVLYHLAAVVAGCLASAPASPLEWRVFEWFRPYCDVVDQGVGYRYYARLDMTVDPAQPRPWGTPIVLAEMEFREPDGSIRREMLRLPDANPTRPRIRHQRRIDLAFHLAAEPRWAASYARHLCKSLGCERVALYSQTHNIPDLRRAASAHSGSESWLDPEDGSTYGPRYKLGEFRCTDFETR